MSDTKGWPSWVALLHPRYWLIALGIAIWWLLVQLLPFRVQMYLGKLLGLLLYRSNISRKRIAERNIALCFPELTPTEQQDLVKKQLISVARGFFDTGIAWFWPYWRLQKRIEVIGLDHLKAANARGNGVLFIGLHFTSMEISSPGINRNVDFPIGAVYRSHDNALFDYVQRLGRERHSAQIKAIPKQDVRAMVRRLKNKGVLAYLPDQDYGKKYSVFVPFFNISTATIKIPSQLMKLGKPEVLSYFVVRNPEATGYQVYVYPGIEGFDGSDEVKDAAALNRFIEARVREHPEHYFWVHRRFKSRPEGEESLYKR